jgi:hypothetical protein
MNEPRIETRKRRGHGVLGGHMARSAMCSTRPSCYVLLDTVRISMGANLCSGWKQKAAAAMHIVCFFVYAFARSKRFP